MTMDAIVAKGTEIAVGFFASWATVATQSKPTYAKNTYVHPCSIPVKPYRENEPKHTRNRIHEFLVHHQPSFSGMNGS